MERMGDILARSARLRARRTRPSAAASAAPTPAAPPTQLASQPARAPSAATPAATPARPPRASQSTRAAMPAAARPTPRPAPPVADVAPPVIPPADALHDALDGERILELPARYTAAGARAARAIHATQAAQVTQAPTARRVTAPLAAASSAPSDSATSRGPRTQRGQEQPLASHERQRGAMSAGSSGMLALGAATQGYAQALRSTRRASARAPRAASARPALAPDVCPQCQGAGYVRLDVPVGDPAFGQAVACVCTERLLEERRLANLRRLSSLDAFRDKTFATFDATPPGVREALEVAQRYAEDPHGWLVLSGGYGVGKTHLAAAIAHACIARGQAVIFSIVPDLLDHLRATFAPSSETPYDELFDWVREAGVLVLDDLGAENATAWATEKLFQIINYRYNFQMPTVVTTNHRLLAHMDERIRSRLSDVSFVRNVSVDASDYRERHGARARQASRAAAPGQSRAPARGGQASQSGQSSQAGPMDRARGPRGAYQR